MAELKPYLRGPWVVSAVFSGPAPAPPDGYGAQAPHWFQVLNLIEEALARGATEVRIRPVKP